MPIAEKFQKLRETKEALRVIADATAEEPFSNYPAKIQEKIDSGGSAKDEFWNLRTNNGTNGEYLFANLNSNLSNNFIDYIKNMDTSKMTSISNMFNSNKFFTELDLKKWNVSQVISANDCFSNMTSLTILDLTGWNTANVKNIPRFLHGCTNLTEVKGILDIRGVSTSTSILSMLGNGSYYSAKKLEKIYIKNLNASGLTLEYVTNLIKECLLYLFQNALQQTATRTLVLGPDNIAKCSAEELAIITNKGFTIS